MDSYNQESCRLADNETRFSADNSQDPNFYFAVNDKIKTILMSNLLRLQHNSFFLIKTMNL
jgi:hypothetical protein